MLQSLSRYATALGAIGLLIGGILVGVAILAFRQGRLMLFTKRHGTTIWIHGTAARVYALIFLVAGLSIAVPGFLLVFRVFFDISTELMLGLMITGILLFTLGNVIALLTASKSVS